MRRLLLWMAGNGWLRRNLPRLWFTRRAVRRFMPGETAEEAIAAAEKFRQQGTPVLFTLLGENLTRIEDADAHAQEYLEVIAEINERGLDAEISVKPTQLGYDLDQTRTLGHLERLADAAAPRTVWIDMESSAYTEGTVALYEALKRSRPNSGLCLQSYLKRTHSDIERLLPLAPRIRMVKGAYAEPAEICYRSRREVDANYLALCVWMLDQLRNGHELFLGLGTHDVDLVRQVADYARSAGFEGIPFDVEMLYGIRADQQQRLKEEGFPVRVLIAYGRAWYPWYMRRLAERPANVIFAIRQLLPPW
ncbi:MAG TPA: proline dehydrogenase family protein [Candidatus Limnocylindrales bacterium]|jgi:proline dehydrogenase|nr:proline dehydrogenase family protein [Candidatus Limnocylindrales bacterium]